jgi:hypothetical protein
LIVEQTNNLFDVIFLPYFSKKYNYSKIKISDIS